MKIYVYLPFCAKIKEKTQKTQEFGYLQEAGRNGVEKTEGIGGGVDLIFLSITL